MNQPAAGAVSPDYLKFRAVIKSAASAASRKPKSREGSSRGLQDDCSAGRRRPLGTPLELPSLDFDFLEAALAGRPDQGLKFYLIRGGCASSRLVHGFSDSVCEGLAQVAKYSQTFHDKTVIWLPNFVLNLQS